ncbi:WD40-repeat-containing domain protein [Aspergillus avenaceus]|uniref:WD40-repeat-containing domain protein n=1 Tax=Aspergillus avenaceus TaxID=36643 RepID=A0A5N6TWV8_ASPAV|nr:WD40-repeat-containing domain protein [Aspergillus avenaceus]
MRWTPLLLSLLGANQLWTPSALADPGHCKTLEQGGTDDISDCCSGSGTGESTTVGNKYEYTCGKRLSNRGLREWSWPSAKECVGWCIQQGCTAASYIPGHNPRCIVTVEKDFTFKDESGVLGIVYKGSVESEDCAPKIEKVKEQCEAEKKKQKEDCDRQKQRIEEDLRNCNKGSEECDRRRQRAEDDLRKCNEGSRKCEDEKQRADEDLRKCNEGSKKCEDEKQRADEDLRRCNEGSKKCEDEKQRADEDLRKCEDGARECEKKKQDIDKQRQECKAENDRLKEIIQNSQQATWEPRRELNDFSMSLAFSPADGGQLVTTDAQRNVRIMDVNSDTTVESWNVGQSDTGMVSSIAMSRDGRKVLLGTHDQKVKLWDRDRGSEDTLLQETQDNTPSQVAISPDGKHMAAGLRDGRILLWDSVKKQIQISTQPGPIAGLAMTNDILATGSTDQKIKIWELGSGVSAGEISNLPADVQSIVATPDGKGLACGLKNGRITMYNIVDKTERRNIDAHKAPVNQVAFSPDGRQLASASDDGTVRIWSLTDDFIVPTSQTNKFLAVSFSSDGKYLAALTGGYKARIWGRK